jgi:hypothetical protein
MNDCSADLASRWGVGHALRGKVPARTEIAPQLIVRASRDGLIELRHERCDEAVDRVQPLGMSR